MSSSGCPFKGSLAAAVSIWLSVITAQFTINLKLCFWCLHFLVLCCIFLFVGQLPLLIIRFCQRPMGLSPRGKEAAPLQDSLAVHELNYMCNDPSLPTFGRSELTGHLTMGHICYWRSDLWTWELVAKFLLYSVTQLIYHGHWKWNHVVGGLVLFH